jgi:hypothetical protein
MFRRCGITAKRTDKLTPEDCFMITVIRSLQQPWATQIKVVVETIQQTAMLSDTSRDFTEDLSEIV